MQRVARDFRGFAEADDAGDILGAGAKAALVMAPVKELAQVRASADVQGADSLWPVKFVAGEGKKIDL